ncbi:MAG: hypothetical protein CL682_05460 [Brevundimonas sp.]|nr:hypothetical protein [Brevundimonas sp.]
MNLSEAFLNEQIPLNLRPMIPATLKTAYAAAATLIKDEPILNVQSAKDGRGRIVQWAVDLGFQRLVTSGQWPFDMDWKYFAHPTGRYLEIRPSHSVLTISQLSDPKKQPRDVRFRANKRLSAMNWLTNLPDPREQEKPANGIHILLVHGHQTLNFSHLGIPNPNHRRGYLYRTPDLMLMPHEVEAPEHPLEDTDTEAVMTLKEEIDKWRRDSGAY